LLMHLASASSPVLLYYPLEMAPRRLSLHVFALLAAAALSFLLAPARPALASPPADPSTQNVVELHIDDEIEPILAEYIVNGINQANQQHASLILITLSTPGGLDTSMRQIISAILASKVPVVTYVSPTGSRAASAGFFILLSADIAAMSPGTDTGAASPITAIGGQPVQVDQTLSKKILNEANAYLRSYATKRGRNPDLASTAVTDAKAFTEKEALEGHLIDLIANSREDLLAKLNGRSIARFDGTTAQLSLPHPAVAVIEMTGREKFLSRIVQPDAFFILLVLGALGLYVEFTHPGLFAPGVIGGIALLLALFAMHLLPVNFVGILLLVLALGLFALEAKYPTHGVLGVGGMVAMLLGALMLIRSPLTGRGVSLFTALSVVIPFAIIVMILTRLVLRSHQWKVSTGREEMLGEEGQVTEPVAAGSPGMVFVHGELWRAVAVNGEAIPQGARVRIRKIAGLTLEVEPTTR
jgi:membrane-bound serine protease (ClpP class)